MKKFIINFILFGLVFFLLDKLFYVFLFTSPKMETDKRLESLLEGKINKEVIIMGSSRGAYDIIAGQLEAETGLTAYNMAYAGSNIQFHTFVLKTLLKYNKKPKMIVLTIDDPAELLFDKTLNFRLDRLYPLVKYNYINQELIGQGDKNVLSHVFCLARLNKGNFNWTKKKMNPESPMLDCGSTPFIDTLKKKDFVFRMDKMNYNPKNEIKDKQKALQEFQEICNKNNIRIVYCFTPNFRAYDAQLENRIKKTALPGDKFFVYDTANAKYKDSGYFYDESHLNIKGARIFTAELSNFINLNK